MLEAFFSNVMGVPRLSGLSDDGANPFVSLCCAGLRLEQGLGELIWELPTLGPRVPSFLIGAYHGSDDQELLGSALGPSDHPERHSLLRATIAGPDHLKMAF